MNWNLKLIGVGALSLIFVGLVFQIKLQKTEVQNLTEKQAQITERYQTLLRNNQGLADSLQTKEKEVGDLQASLTRYMLDQQALQVKYTKTQNQLSQLKKVDREYQDWSNQPVPASVVRLLDDAASGNPDQNSGDQKANSGAVSSTNPSTGSIEAPQ